MSVDAGTAHLGVFDGGRYAFTITCGELRYLFTSCFSRAEGYCARKSRYYESTETKNNTIWQMQILRPTGLRIHD